jgi:hypothetical protein
MQTINLRVNFLDGETIDIETVASDYIAFETKFDKSISELANDARMTYLFYLAWHAFKRTKRTELDFEQWTETISMVGAVDEKK